MKWLLTYISQKLGGSGEWASRVVSVIGLVGLKSDILGCKLEMVGIVSTDNLVVPREVPRVGMHFNFPTFYWHFFNPNSS